MKLHVIRIALLAFVVLSLGTFVVLGQRENPASQAASTKTVLDFGARGNGQADDTAAVQRAVDGGGEVVFPPGTYKLTKTVEIDLAKVGFTALVAHGPARVVMAGSGPAFRFVGTHEGTAAPDSVKPQLWERERMPTVEGLAIAGGHDEADGIEASGTMQITIRGVHIRGVRHAIHLVKRNRNVLIDACHIYENRGIGIYYDRVNLHQTNISASHISYCDGGGIVVRGGDVRNIHIAGCDIEGNHAQDGPPTANVLFDCADGSVAEAAIVGCTIQHTKDAPQSANIRILGTGVVRRSNQDMTFNCGHVTIGDNVFSDVQTNIHLDGARGVTIVGNTFWQGYEHNLLVENSLHVVVGANSMERNPLYGYTSEARNGVRFVNCRDCTISGLHLHLVQGSPAALILEKCRRMHVTGCTLLDNDGVALLLADVSDSRIAGNLIRDDRPNPSTPIRASGGSGNLIADNVVTGRPEIAAGVGIVRDNDVVESSAPQK
ncbi:MAG TPA: right-handed parallel beta-helix repeat-containing protein [Pirellulaceae bacterium]|nr:right-handed parallel beta-helix repeat-containing protein [Pirellulaceae bacterium]